jgi:choline dehydrogenase-like flavoprotein
VVVVGPDITGFRFPVVGLEAGVQAGYPRTDDLNGYQQEGFGPMDRTVTPQGHRAIATVVVVGPDITGFRFPVVGQAVEIAPVFQPWSADAAKGSAARR